MTENTTTQDAVAQDVRPGHWAGGERRAHHRAHAGAGGRARGAA